MEVFITDGDIITIEWLQDVLHDMEINKNLFSTEMQENLHNAQGFLHRIKTNAVTLKKLDPQKRK